MSDYNIQVMHGRVGCWGTNDVFTLAEFKRIHPAPPAEIQSADAYYASILDRLFQPGLGGRPARCRKVYDLAPTALRDPNAAETNPAKAAPDQQMLMMKEVAASIVQGLKGDEASKPSQKK